MCWWQHVPSETLELHAVTENVEELVHGGAVSFIAEHLFLLGLPEALVHDAELVVITQHVLVIVNDQLGAVRVQYRRQVLTRHVRA